MRSPGSLCLGSAYLSAHALKASRCGMRWAIGSRAAAFKHFYIKAFLPYQLGAIFDASPPARWWLCQAMMVRSWNPNPMPAHNATATSAGDSAGCCNYNKPCLGREHA